MKKTKYMYYEIIYRASSVTTISFLTGNQSPKFSAPSSRSDVTEPPVCHETSEQSFTSVRWWGPGDEGSPTYSKTLELVTMSKGKFKPESAHLYFMHDFIISSNISKMVSAYKP